MEQTLITKPQIAPVAAFKSVVVLKHNVGMIRDAWLEEKTETTARYFVVRQVSFDPLEGSNGVQTKLFRFDESEVRLLIKLFQVPPVGFPPGDEKQ